MKNKLKIIRELYDIRASIYTLFIFASLLFLLNLKSFNINFIFYIVVLFILLSASISEFLFSIKYAAIVFHQTHPLRQIFERVQKHHFYNIILLPIAQYVSCGILMYYSKDLAIELIMIIITAIMTYA